MANIRGLSDINGEGSDDDNRKHNDYYAGGEKRQGCMLSSAPATAHLSVDLLLTPRPYSVSQWPAYKRRTRGEGD